MSKPELEPVNTIEAMHLAGQQELDFAMLGLAKLINSHPTTVPRADLFTLMDELMDRRSELDIQPEAHDE